MALNVSKRKPKKPVVIETVEQARFQTHLKALGLNTEAEYRAWCARQGLSTSLRKTRSQLSMELAAASRERADSRLNQKKREQRSFRASVEDIFSGKLKVAEITSPALRMICQAYDSLQANEYTKTALRDLLCRVGESTDLLRTTPVIQQYGVGQGNSYLGGLMALAHQAAHWLRPVSNWKPVSHNVSRQFQSLTRHLLARWPVPAFMDSVWFLGTSPHARVRQQWFIHLGLGHNIRTAEGLPVACHKRMAHHFMEAPPDLTVDDALRWGQIQALGGSVRLIRAILGTRLRTDWEHDDFWQTVIQFFIANPMLDLAHVGPIVDYLQNERFTAQEVFIEGHLVRLPPPQPNLTMKGRLPEVLLRNVEKWHRQLSKQQQGPAEWAASGIQKFRFVEGSESAENSKVWTITELVSTAALNTEGRQMKHCVATYARSCQQGYCSIWTMEVQTREGRSKVLTLEVANATRTLVQARGKCNVLPTQKERGILSRWAEQAGLQVARWV